ncbi:unnamed protein product [Phytophthora lilii]|uniref:Unnamed protein product n=1 Tax=Phytophthora lilii TaxID=2077276 RepID=A0A9W7D9P6_9STRA|nr:unnamed protein product [Phytophthora lilii]
METQVVYSGDESDVEDKSEEGAVDEPQEITNDLDQQQECYQAAQASAHLAAPYTGGEHQDSGDSVHPRGYYPSGDSTGASRFLENLRVPHPLIGLARLAHRALSGAPAERGYGAYASPHVRSASKKSRTTYESAAGSIPRSRPPSGSQLGAAQSAPMCSVKTGSTATSQGAGAFLPSAAPREPAPHGSGVLRSGQEAPVAASLDPSFEPSSSTTVALRPSSAPQAQLVALQQEEIRLLRERDKHPIEKNNPLDNKNLYKFLLTIVAACIKAETTLLILRWAWALAARLTLSRASLGCSPPHWGSAPRGARPP